MQSPAQRRKNAQRRSMRTLSEAQIRVLRELATYSRSQSIESAKRWVHRTVNPRMTVSALARKGLVDIRGEDFAITQKGRELILRNVRNG